VCGSSGGHHGITSGTLVIDDTDNPRSKSAKTLAICINLRDKESGGYLWGANLVFLLLVTPKFLFPWAWSSISRS